MKNTRKKMLLSSIAMLLVALIALGSATFAWYFSNATVTASTNTFKAAADTGLVIRHHATGSTGTAWGPTVTDMNSAPATGLSPASITYASTFTATRGGTATSTAYDASTMKAGTLSPATIEDGNNFLVDEFFVASANDTTQTATLKVKGGAAVAGGYLNLAVYVDGNLKAVYTNDNSFDAATGFGKLKNAASGTDVEVDDSNYTTNVAKFTGNETADASVSCTKKDSGGAHVQIVAFADGFNANCKSSAISNATPQITYEVSVNNNP